MRLPWRRPAEAGAPRWLVVDVESSGLDPVHDRLLAIAAVAARPLGARLVVDIGDSFEVVLRHPEAEADKANILVHGIGVAAQRGGTDPGAALASFGRFVAGAPLVGFHAAFDRTLIERACRACRQPAPGRNWLDLADLAPVLSPSTAAHALDDWLAAFAIAVTQRHRAAADALATAALLQKLWPLARAQGEVDFRSLARLAASRRWLGG